MKTTIKVILWIAWCILCTLAVCNPEKLGWKIAFTVLWLYFTWLYICIKRAKEMPDDYDERYKFK